MFAIIKTGGKQYRVSANDKLTVERLPNKIGETISFDQVLLIGEGDNCKVGSPFVDRAVVKAEIMEATRGPKLIIFKKRRRKSSRTKNGHRQDLTVLKITGIEG